MRQYCNEEKSGWIRRGRSSPGLRVVASRIALREWLRQREHERDGRRRRLWRTAPERAREHIAAAEANVAADKRCLIALADRVAAARVRLGTAFAARERST